MTSTSCLKHQNVTQFITDVITTIRSNNERPDKQSVFEYINKTSGTCMDQKYIMSVKEVMLSKSLIYEKPS